MGVNAEAFIRANTALAAAPPVPEIRLHLASEITPIWQASEGFLSEKGVEPPFWAFAWPGSRLLARFILDNPARVRGKRVLDVACGCGVAAIAAAMSGAAQALANDIDPLALAAAALNAAENGVAVTPVAGDLIGTEPDCDLLLIGDVCYNAPMAARIVPWLRDCAARHEVWLCDPGRHYAPDRPGEILAQRDVPTSLELEDTASRATTLFRLRP